METKVLPTHAYQVSSFSVKANQLFFVLVLIVCAFLPFYSLAQCPSPPTITSPVNLCMNTTASQLTASGTNLLWGGNTGSVGGNNTFSTYTYVDNSSNNKRTNFTTVTANAVIQTVDYYITPNQSVSGLVLSIYNNSGTVIATSTTNTSLSAGTTAVKVTSTFNYTIATAGNYSIGISSGSGNIGYDSPSFPMTETSGTINITGVTSSPYRCFNNMVFGYQTATAPTPSTASAGTTNYYVTQTANGCTSSPATISVVVSATGGSAPTVTSPVNLCLNATNASALTATGTNLSWGGALGSVGGTGSFSVQTYVDNSGNNKRTNFTTTASTTINTIDYYILPNQAVSGIVLSIYNSSGTVIATSTTNTTLSPGASGAKVTNTFNYTIASAGNYSIGVSAGSGNIGYDSPAFPMTETSGTINITGVTSSPYRCFNNIVFVMNSNPAAPVPPTSTLGSTNFYVTQTVSGCKSPAATINVIVNATGGSAPTVSSPVNYCQNSTGPALTASGSALVWTVPPIQVSAGGTANFSTFIYVDNNSNNRKTNFTTTSANVNLTSIDYYITPNQAVSGLVLSLYNSSGTVIATSTTNTSASAGATGIKISNTFNYTITTAGNYSIGVSSGSGNIGYDSPSYPITESTGTINITGVTNSNYRCFNNIVFTITTTSVAPVPVTTTVGTANYAVAQTVNGCLSPTASITVNVTSGSNTTIAYGGPYCNSLASPQAVIKNGSAPGTFSSTAGLSINSTTGAVTPASSSPGTYTVTYTMSSGCASTATANVTISPIPFVTISYNGSPYCSNAGTANVTRSGTAGGTYSSTTGLVIDATTGDVNLGSSTLGTYTVTYFIAASGCSSYQTTTTITIGTAGIWTGASNTVWGNSGNWYCGQIPTSSINVMIPGSLTNYPNITSTANVNNINIASGASVTINNGTLRVAGAISNSGTLNASNGTLVMSGTGSQSIAANTFQNNAVKNLTISNASSGGVTINGQLDVYSALTYSGTGMKLFTNDLLTLKSTSTLTALIGVMTGNTITGQVTVERYISAKKAWRLLSIPTNTTQTMKQAWQEGAASSASNPAPGYGIQVPGNTSTWTTDGFDQFANTACVKTYNSASNSWSGIPNTSNAIKSTSGYIAFIRGDRSVVAYNATPTSTILRTKGTLYTGNQSAISVSASKFAVIGNPYASALDMRNITRSGLKDFFYVWDPNLGSATSYGGFQTFSLSGGNYLVTPGGGSYGASGSVSNYINSGYAFFVQATATGGTITLTEAAKTSVSSARVFSSASQPQLKVNMYGINPDSSTYMIDGLRIDYDDTYSNNVDDMDAFKSANSSENLSIKNIADLLIIERRHTIVDKDTVFLNLTNPRVQSYRFEISAEDINQPGIAGFLQDKYLNTVTPIDLNGTTEFNFNIANIPGSYAADRFRIVFEKLTPVPVTFTSIKAYRNNNNINVEWSVENEVSIKNYVTERSANGTDFTELNTTIAKANGAVKADYLDTDITPLNGYNFYRVKSVGIDGKIAYSSTVKVLMEKAKNDAMIASAVITGNTINIRFNNMPAGIYSVNLFDNLGQKLMTKNIQYAGGSSIQHIPIDRALGKGIYQLQVISPAKEKLSYKLIY